jgi:hypothetical protein
MFYLRKTDQFITINGRTYQMLFRNRMAKLEVGIPTEASRD